jgi:hypothetical protein
MTILNLGNSVNNIQITENILSKEEHKKLLDYVEIVDNWHTQPWGVKTLSPAKQTFQIVMLLDKVFMFAHKECTNFYGADLYDFDRGSIPLIKFEKNYKMNEHADTTGDFAALYYINDDYGGGEINFMDFGLKIKPKANSLITFPSNSDYWHEVLENTEKERYSATTWFKFSGSSLERPELGLLR